MKIKLFEDIILKSSRGIEFIFPVYPIVTVEKLKAKISEYTEKMEKAKKNKNKLEAYKALKMILLLKDLRFSLDPMECQMSYFERGVTAYPTISPEEKEILISDSSESNQLSLKLSYRN